jgi:hypothetical protein
MANSNPSIDPALQSTLAGAISFGFDKMMQATDKMLPAKVIAYDRDANRAQVQPLIALVTTDNTVIPRAQFASIPVLVLGGGGFMLNFNLSPGDLGWIFANDRDISGFLQTYSEAKPNTVRKNSFADALFIPDVMKGYTIDGEDSDAVVLQSLDGTIKISLNDSRIKIKAPLVEIEQDVTIAGNLTVQGNIVGEAAVTAEGALTANGVLVANDGITSNGGGANNSVFNGNLRTNGNITASGSITPNVP